MIVSYGLTMALLSPAAVAGGYFNPFKLAALLLLTLPWIWLLGWVDKDVKTSRMPKQIWMPALVSAGLIGLLAWLLVPVFIAGMAVYLILVLVAVIAYVMQRNARVIPEARVLTGDWFSQLFSGSGKSSMKVITKLKLYGKGGQPVVVPMEGTAEEKLVFNNTQDMLYDVLWRRASEVDLSPTAEAMNLRFVIDGVVEKGEPMDRGEGLAIVDYIKEIAGMDLEDKRRPQEGKIAVDLAGQQMDVDVMTAGGKAGPRMQLKIVQEAVKTKIAELGMFDDMIERVKSIVDHKNGLIIVSGRPRNGLTSTLYSLLRLHDAYIQQLSTTEEKPDIDMENVTQNTYKGQSDLARVLASTLRRDPDVVMVDSCTNAEAAGLIVNWASEKQILLGVHAPDSFSALAKWASTVGDTKKAVGSLRAIVNQVLVRKLCPNCREAYQPNLDMLRKANLPTDKVDRFYRTPTKELTDEKGRPMVCPTCQGSGFFGRTAVFELLVINDELRKLLAAGANLTQIKAAARKNRMLYLQEEALKLVMEGATSVQEVIRVTKPKKEQG